MIFSVGGKLNQRRVFELGVDGHDVLGVILDGARLRILRARRERPKSEGDSGDEDEFGIHAATAPWGMEIRALLSLDGSNGN